MVRRREHILCIVEVDRRWKRFLGGRISTLNECARHTAFYTGFLFTFLDFEQCYINALLSNESHNC